MLQLHCDVGLEAFSIYGQDKVASLQIRLVHICDFTVLQVKAKTVF